MIYEAKTKAFIFAYAKISFSHDMAHFILVVSAGFGQHSLATNITLLRANEVDDIVRGDGEKYKDTGLSSETPLRT